jgi:hypothetical protein
MFESSYRAILSLRHDITRAPDRENHLLVFRWNIELLVFGATPNRDSIEDYPEIGGSAYWNPAIEAYCISMVGLARADSQNNSSKYSTIRGSEASDTRTPSSRVLQILNPDFNTVRLQTIMESIQRMVSQDSLLVALAQQGLKWWAISLQQNARLVTIRASNDA